jgi:cyclophilin family peptidyl-prolyl cis-trans isomerase/HEAT repeat protein
MRKAFPLVFVFALACTTATPPPALPAPAPPPATPQVFGLSVDEEASILALEDRREYDAAVVDTWAKNPNVLHRVRLAMALGRIGPHTFIDTNNNGERDPGEHQAGIDVLTTLARDGDRNVRIAAAFALGQVRDTTGIDPLIVLAHDDDAGVAGEAVEALSKMAKDVTLARYAEFTNDAQRQGVRVLAIRYLFRFASDEASAIAARALDANNAAVREAATYALARRGYAPARAALELLLKDTNPLTRAYAASALGRIGDKQSVPLLLDSARDGHPWVRTNSLVAITRIAAKDATALDRPTFAQDAQSLVDLVTDADNGTRVSAIDVLGLYAARSEIAKRRLAEITTTGSRWDREQAWGAWAKQFADAKPQTAWEKVRVIENRWTRGYANDPDPMVRASTLGSMADDAVDANADIIRRGLDDADIIVRANAIDRFAKSKARDAATLVTAEERGRRDAQSDARLAAIVALADIDRPEREPFLRGLLKDADPVVRRVAADMIEEKLKKNRPQYTPLAVRPVDYAAVVRWSHDPHTATIHMTRGNITMQLLPQDAPMTAWNFAQLARNGYFNNSTFMRVVPNFVIQGGDPRNDMNGGPGYSIRDEINLQKYTRGAVGMALSGPDTGGSQFFITHSAQPHLDGGYTIFGRVTEGEVAVVDQTERGDLVSSITIDDAVKR